MAGFFLRDTRGNFAIMTALALVPLIGAIGMAVDYSIASRTKANVQNATDSASLAAARDVGLTDAQRVDIGKRFLESSVSGITLDSYDVVVSNGSATATAKVKPKTMFMGIFGTKWVEVNARSVAAIGGKPLEVVMALDITGSMGDKLASGETRISALKTAAISAINELVPATPGPASIRVGLVPYSATVNVTPVLDKVKYTGKSDGCVAERVGGADFTDAYAGTGKPLTGIKISVGDDGCPASEILPLSDSRAVLTAAINALKTGGTTAGHLGVAWSQYMLSTNWNPAWPAASQTGVDSATDKFVVIMTDGEFNTFMSSGDKNSANGKTKSREYALGICSELKKNARRVFTISFEGGTEAEDLMAQCATPNSGLNRFYFKATNAADLNDAFKAIVKQIKTLRLVS